MSADPPQPPSPPEGNEDATPQPTATTRNRKSSSRWEALRESLPSLDPNNNLVGCGASLILIFSLAVIFIGSLVKSL